MKQLDQLNIYGKIGHAHDLAKKYNKVWKPFFHKVKLPIIDNFVWLLEDFLEKEIVYEKGISSYERFWKGRS